MSILAPTRRGFLRFLGAGIVAAPTIVRASSLMALPRRPNILGQDFLAMLHPSNAQTLDVINRELDNAIMAEFRVPLGALWEDLAQHFQPIGQARLAGNTAWFSRGLGAFDL